MYMHKVRGESSMMLARSKAILLQRPRCLVLHFYSSSSSSTSASAGQSPAGPLKRYEELVALGVLKRDEQQHRVAAMLDHLFENLKAHNRSMHQYSAELQKWKRIRQELRQKMLEEEAAGRAEKATQGRGSWRESIAKLFTRRGTRREIEPGSGKMVARITREKNLDLLVGPRPVPPQAPRGIYLYGSVGCGKTLLMDLLFSSTEGVVRYRRRMHFHAAMLEVHEQMQKVWTSWRLRNAEMSKDSKEEEEITPRADSVSPIFDAIADGLLKRVDDEFEGASLLCFDEVQVVDPFTAVAFAGILGRLLNKGLVLVATSNRPFTELNKDGLQKEVFMKFVERLDQHSCLVSVGNGIDYRRVLAESHQKDDQTRYFWPLSSQAAERMELKWREMLKPFEKDGMRVSCTEVPVMFGRILKVPQSCDGIARFTFEQLCDQPTGAADYMAVAQTYHTVFVTGIPVMSMKIRDKARRFITLVDELYNHKCRLICLAAAPPDELFLGTDEGPLIDLEGVQFESEAEASRLRRNVLASGNVSPVTEQRNVQLMLSGYEEMFAFRRAASRLIEMQCPSYPVKWG